MAVKPGHSQPTMRRDYMPFYMRNLRKIICISWKDKVTNKEVLKRSKIQTMAPLLKQRPLRWLGHTRRMEDGRIPKDLLVR